MSACTKSIQIECLVCSYIDTLFILKAPSVCEIQPIWNDEFMILKALSVCEIQTSFMNLKQSKHLNNKSFTTNNNKLAHQS